jgi:hypothetical protein
MGGSEGDLIAADLALSPSSPMRNEKVSFQYEGKSLILV